jgi:hypothetical protein
MPRLFSPTPFSSRSAPKPSLPLHSLNSQSQGSGTPHTPHSPQPECCRSTNTPPHTAPVVCRCQALEEDLRGVRRQAAREADALNKRCQEALLRQREDLNKQLHAAQRTAGAAEDAARRLRQELAAEFKEKAVELESRWEKELEGVRVAAADAQQEIARLDADALTAARREASAREAAEASGKAAAAEAAEARRLAWELVRAQQGAADEAAEAAATASALKHLEAQLADNRATAAAAANTLMCGAHRRRSLCMHAPVLVIAHPAMHVLEYNRQVHVISVVVMVRSLEGRLLLVCRSRAAPAISTFVSELPS